jgi:hypothetical protein
LEEFLPYQIFWNNLRKIGRKPVIVPLFPALGRWRPGKPGLHSKTLSQKTKQSKTKVFSKTTEENSVVKLSIWIWAFL